MKKNQIVYVFSVIVALCFLLLTQVNIVDEPSSATTSNPSITEVYEGEEYTFRNDEALESHYKKHGIEMGYASAKDYEEAASNVVNNPNALHKKEKEDNDDVYYVEDTNEFVIVSTDGYIRTYFYPDSGINYYNKQ